MPDYDNKGQIALWKNEDSNDKAPNAKGHFFAHRDIKAGEKIEVALWRNRSDNEKAPMMKGKISDVRQQQGSQHPDLDDDEDLPF